jgi:hypothetical protein
MHNELNTSEKTIESPKTRLSFSSNEAQVALQTLVSDIYAGREPDKNFWNDVAVYDGTVVKKIALAFPDALDSMLRAVPPEQHEVVPTFMLGRLYRGLDGLGLLNTNNVQLVQEVLGRMHVQEPWPSSPGKWLSGLQQTVGYEITQAQFGKIKKISKDLPFAVSNGWVYLMQSCMRAAIEENIDRDQVTYKEYFDMLPRVFKSKYEEVEHKKGTLEPVLAEFTFLKEPHFFDFKIPVANLTPYFENSSYAIAKQYLKDQEQQGNDIGSKVSLIQWTEKNSLIAKRVFEPWYWPGLEDATLEEQAAIWSWATSWAPTEMWPDLLGNMHIFPDVMDIGMEFTGKDSLWWATASYDEKYVQSLEWLAPARVSLRQQKNTVYLNDFFNDTLGNR